MKTVLDDQKILHERRLYIVFQECYGGKQWEYKICFIYIYDFCNKPFFAFTFVMMNMEDKVHLKYMH